MTVTKKGANPAHFRRVEIGRLQQDLFALRNLQDKFDLDEWSRISKSYPNAFRNVQILIEATELAIEKLEK